VLSNLTALSISSEGGTFLKFPGLLEQGFLRMQSYGASLSVARRYTG